MKIKTRLFLFLMALTFLLGGVTDRSLSGQAVDSPAREQNRRLGRGINIIGYDPIWFNFEERRFQERHFAKIEEGGFNGVRINLHPFKHMQKEPPYTLNDSWLEVLDWAVAGSTQAGLTAILDMHEFGEMADDPVGNKGRFLSFWQQIAPRYKDYGRELVFEILNEPNRNLTPEMWNLYLREGLELIRQTNPHRTVIIGPAFWNNFEYLKDLRLPEEDRNIIVTIHYYLPFRFTHQGASWAENAAHLSGIEWTGTAEENRAIQADFGKAQQWAQENDRPLFLGEFGAYDKADIQSRVRWTSFVARTAEKLGWSWAYWQFDSDFIAFDISQDRWVDPIWKALIPWQHR
ncbi:MAG: glycoside hydrolase family 5 protein [Acidobacteriota bacterium]|nr:MAG: glycoside hydrolase family 5 protein [Acidobacteriota bacterium]